jgi:hypothetical protein
MLTLPYIECFLDDGNWNLRIAGFIKGQEW